MPRPASTSARRHDNRNDDDGEVDKSSFYAFKDRDIPSPTADEQSALTPQVDTTVHSSLLQPRVAVALGLSAKWHPLLFACRLLSTVPAFWWGLPVAMRLLAQGVLLVSGQQGGTVCVDGKRQGSSTWLWGYAAGATGKGNDGWADFETRLRVTEMALGIVWCGASAYLSFFFTDCLMSRWLLNYTPQATLVRLLTINTVNLYLTSQTLHLTGGSADPRLFLPAWITIATTLTGLYHLTQRKINIRKETSMSISVFSIASFISMVALLAQLHLGRPDEQRAVVPGFMLASRAWEWVETVAGGLSLVEWRDGERDGL